MNFLQIGTFTEVDVALWTLYATVIIGIVTFIFNTISIKQTAKAQKDMSRPYLNFYLDITAIKSGHRFFVLKNFGTSPAYIKSIEFDIPPKANSIDSRIPFQALSRGLIAPGQKISSVIDDDIKGTYRVKLNYTDNHGKSYDESFIINTMAFQDIGYSAHSENKDEVSDAIRQSTIALIRDLKN